VISDEHLREVMEDVNCALDVIEHEWTHERWERLSIALTSLLLLADDARGVVDEMCAVLDRAPAIEAEHRRERLRRRGAPNST